MHGQPVRSVRGLQQYGGELHLFPLSFRVPRQRRKLRPGILLWSVLPRGGGVERG